MSTIVGRAPLVGVQRARTAARPAARSAAIPLWEMAFAVLGLFLCLDAGIRTVRIVTGVEGPIQIVGGKGADYSEGSALTQVLLFAVYLFSVMLMVIHPPRLFARAFRPALLWVIPTLALVSILWSDAPMVSLRRAVALAGCSIFGLYLATRYSLATLLRLLLAVSVIAMALSLLVAAVLPSYAIDPFGYWQGVFGQKNQLGQFMALAAVLWLLYAASGGRYRLLVGFGALATLLVVLSRSATSLVLLVTLVALLILIRLWRLHYTIALPILMMVVVIGGYFLAGVASNPAGVTTLLGKDSGLTGRTQLWDLVWRMIRSHFGLGYGYGGFWLGFQGPSAPIWRVTGWNPPNAHDGYLDLLLDLGIVGLGIFVAALIGALWRAFALARRGRMLEAAFPLIFLIYFLISNITESYLVAYNSLAWVLFVALTIHLHLWWQAERGPRGRAGTSALAMPVRDSPASRSVPAAPQQEKIAFQEGNVMSARVTVSAIMPTYNVESYVKDAIDSILAQTFKDWELIVVDDGSTDETAALLAQYDDPRIRFFETGENHGPAHARNIALGFACGKYIAICDGDDIFLPERFAKQVAYLESHPEVHVVASQLSFFWGDEPPHPRLLFPEDPAAIQRRLARGKMAMPFGSAMIRSWCFDRYGLLREELRTAEDFEWFLRIRRGCNFRVLPEVLCLYRYGARQVSLASWKKNKLNERYAIYCARQFGTTGDGALLSLGQFSRRWQTRLALNTWDMLRFAAFRLRLKSRARRLK